MTRDKPTIPPFTGLFPALVAINAGTVAAWHWIFGETNSAVWATWTFLFAAPHAAALRTIARQRAELALLCADKERR